MSADLPQGLNNDPQGQDSFWVVKPPVSPAALTADGDCKIALSAVQQLDMLNAALKEQKISHVAFAAERHKIEGLMTTLGQHRCESVTGQDLVKFQQQLASVGVSIPVNEQTINDVIALYGEFPKIYAEYRTICEAAGEKLDNCVVKRGEETSKHKSSFFQYLAHSPAGKLLQFATAVMIVDGSAGQGVKLAAADAAAFVDTIGDQSMTDATGMDITRWQSAPLIFTDTAGDILNAHSLQDVEAVQAKIEPYLSLLKKNPDTRSIAKRVEESVKKLNYKIRGNKGGTEKSRLAAFDAFNAASIAIDAALVKVKSRQEITQSVAPTGAQDRHVLRHPAVPTTPEAASLQTEARFWKSLDQELFRNVTELAGATSSTKLKAAISHTEATLTDLKTRPAEMQAVIPKIEAALTVLRNQQGKDHKNKAYNQAVNGVINELIQAADTAEKMTRNNLEQLAQKIAEELAKQERLQAARSQEASVAGETYETTRPYTLAELEELGTMDTASLNIAKSLDAGTYDIQDVTWQATPFNNTWMILGSDGTGFQTTEAVKKKFFAALRDGQAVPIHYDQGEVKQFSGDGKIWWRIARDGIAAIPLIIGPQSLVQAGATAGAGVVGWGLSQGVKHGVLPDVGGKIGEVVDTMASWAAEALGMDAAAVTADDVMQALATAESTTAKNEILSKHLSPAFFEAYKQSSPEIGRTLIQLELAIDHGDQKAIAAALNTLEDVPANERGGTLDRAILVGGKLAMQHGVTAVRFIANPGDSSSAYAIVVGSAYQNGQHETKTQLIGVGGEVSALGSRATYWGVGLGTDRKNKEGNGFFFNFGGVKKNAGNTVETSTKKTTFPEALYIEGVGGVILKLVNSDLVDVDTRLGGGVGAEMIEGKSTRLVGAKVFSTDVHSSLFDRITQQFGIKDTAIHFSWLSALDKSSIISASTKAGPAVIGVAPTGTGGVIPTMNIDTRQNPAEIKKGMETGTQLNKFVTTDLQKINWHNLTNTDLQTLALSADTIQLYLDEDALSWTSWMPKFMSNVIEKAHRQLHADRIPTWVRERAEEFIDATRALQSLTASSTVDTHALRKATAKVKDAAGALERTTAGQFLQHWGSLVHWIPKANAAGKISPADLDGRGNAIAEELQKDSATEEDKVIAPTPDALASSTAPSVSEQGATTLTSTGTATDADGVQNVIIKTYSDAACTTLVATTASGAQVTGLTQNTAYYQRTEYQAKNATTGLFENKVSAITTTRTVASISAGTYAPLAVTGNAAAQNIDLNVTFLGGGFNSADIRVAIIDGNNAVVTTLTPTQVGAAVKGDFTGQVPDAFDASAPATYRVQQRTVVNGADVWTTIGADGSIN